MERIGSIGHRHVEISTNFTHFRSHGGFYLQPIRMVVWAVHLLPTIFLSSPAPPATPWPPSPILRHVTPWERIPAGPVETPTTSDNFTSSRGDRGCEHQPLHQTIQSFNLTYTTLRRRHATPITAVGVMDMGHIGLIPLISKEIPPSYPFPQGVREARCEKACCSTLPPCLAMQPSPYADLLPSADLMLMCDVTGVFQHQTATQSCVRKSGMVPARSGCPVGRLMSPQMSALCLQIVESFVFSLSSSCPCGFMWA